MMLERRDSAAPSPEEGPSSPAQSGGKKPVIVYILVLFLVAFLLMTLSLLSHQRSNTEAIGQLQGSVSAMQEVQGLQEQVIGLQKELSEARDTIQELEGAAEQRDGELEIIRRQYAAISSFYSLEQAYAGENFDACQEIIDAMEQDELVVYLSDNLTKSELDRGMTISLWDRYQQLKEAVEAVETAEK